MTFILLVMNRKTYVFWRTTAGELTADVGPQSAVLKPNIVKDRLRARPLPIPKHDSLAARLDTAVGGHLFGLAKEEHHVP